MSKIINTLLFVALILCVFGWAICDFIYGNKIEFWDELFVKYGFVDNPYLMDWHSLRWKFMATERICIVGFVVYYIKGIWRDLAIIYLDFAIGNFVDRIFFNINELTWNDYLIYGFAVWYCFKIFFPKCYTSCIMKFCFMANIFKTLLRT